MSNGYLNFLDYLELRRRVEKRLSRPLPLLTHTLVFGVSALLIGLLGFYYFKPPFDFYDLNYYFISPGFGQFVALWSGGLFLHGLWAFLRSGALGGARSRVIEAEMRARLEQDDSYLSDNPKDLFRLHGLLEDDVRKRSGIFWLMLTVVFINAFAWIPWAITTPSDSVGWTMGILLGSGYLPVLAWSGWRRGRREGKLRKQMEQLFDHPADKRDYWNTSQRLTQVSDDGELVDYEPLVYQGKRKRE
jgi:hypothetical protein